MTKLFNNKSALRSLIVIKIGFLYPKAKTIKLSINDNTGVINVHWKIKIAA